MGMKGGERKRESEGKRTRERGIAREKRMNGRGGRRVCATCRLTWSAFCD